MKNLRLFFAVSILCLASASVFGKGPTTRIVLTAPGLASPIEIVDSNALNAFAVWSGPGVNVNSQEQTSGFIADWADGAVTDRPNGLPRYEVSFYAKYASADGIPVIASTRVPDEALLVTRDIIRHMLLKRPDLQCDITSHRLLDVDLECRDLRRLEAL